MTEDIFTLNGKRSLTIVLDRTSSMAEVIQSMVDFLPKYLIRRYAQDIDQMSLVTFDDHYHGKPLNVGCVEIDYDRSYTGNVLDGYGPTSNLEEYAYWLKTVKTGWGDDHPEAIACALAAARTLDPEASIWLVTDAVPHGVRSGYTDGYPYGCPCSIQLDTTGVNVLLTYTNEQDQAFWETKCPGRVVVVSDLKEKLQEPVGELAYA